MTYDLYGPWSSYTGQNSALYPSSVESDWEKQYLNMQSSVNNWRNAGASSDKLIAGIPFYGHTFTLSNAGQHGLHAPISGAGHGGSILGEDGSMSYLEVFLIFFIKSKFTRNLFSSAKSKAAGNVLLMRSKRCPIVGVATNGLVLKTNSPSERR